MVGEMIPLDLMASSKGRVGITRRFPIGPIAAISPFNFPLNLAAHKLAPAIASGNPIVLKPPSKDPLTMLTVAEIVEEAGAPAGSVSILPMTRELGDRMVADERFKLLTFTGSPSVGWRMKERAGKKKVVLELGGNAGVIVDQTADLDWAVRRTLIGAYTYAGQVCISVQRMFVHEAIWDSFMDRFAEGAKAIKTGDPLDPQTDLGPMVDDAAASRTQRWVDEAVAMGGKVVLGGKADGSFFPPTILTDVPVTAQVCSNEAFEHTGQRLWRRGPPGERLDVRAPDRRVHERPRECLAGVQRARGGGSHRERHPDLPDRSHAVRRRQGLGPGPRGLAVGDRGHDGDPDHGPRPAAVAPGDTKDRRRNRRSLRAWGRLTGRSVRRQHRKGIDRDPRMTGGAGDLDREGVTT
jgi:hypothetical protein